eukprot:evm.model.scf_540EXC.7 EVM.evm.TU.scf_540EXC.7   scf_540EXC:50731-52938(-)
MGEAQWEALMDVTTEFRPGKYAIVTIQKEPVNSMDYALWSKLLDVLDALENDQSVRGAVFLSGLKKNIFTAGNDIRELYAPKTSLERYKRFWVTQNVFLARLYRSRLMTVAAIRGACPAGGCVLSLCCDHRVMTDFGTIGLNEVALGIPVPTLWAKMMSHTLGTGVAYGLLHEAKLLSPQQALSVGLVDEIVSKEELQARAEAWLQKMLQLPDDGRAVTKLRMRKELSMELEDGAEAEAEEAWTYLEQPQIVKVLGAVLQRLSGGRARL